MITKVKMEDEKKHVHLMYKTKAGSMRCAWPTCKRVNTGNGHVIWSPSRRHAVVIG